MMRGKVSVRRAPHCSKTLEKKKEKLMHPGGKKKKTN